MIFRAICSIAVAAMFLPSTASAQTEKPQGVTYRAPSGTTLRLMLDESNLGSEVSLGEMVFPPNSDSGDHQHGAIEIFYVVSGELQHVVNGKTQVLKPGMSGFVRPPDKVRHKTGPAGAKVVVVWVPARKAGKLPRAGSGSRKQSDCGEHPRQSVLGSRSAETNARAPRRPRSIDRSDG